MADVQTVSRSSEPFRSSLEINQLAELTEFEPYGEFTPYDEIEVGKKSNPVEWTITTDTIDAFGLMQDDYHEWYSIDSPFGGRIAPVMASSLIIRTLFPYYVGGLFAGWEGRMFAPLRPDVPYTWQVEVADKWIRNDREWVAMLGTCRDPNGELVLDTKRVHVLDFVTISERDSEAIIVPVPEVVTEADAYTPTPVHKRDEAEWQRDLEKFPITNAWYGRADTPIGQELVPISRQYTWRRARDHAEIMYKYLSGWPDWMASHSFHVHPDAAADKGLAKANISGLDPTGTLVSHMMLALAGTGWLVGGQFAYRVSRQILLDDFVTAKGRVIDKRDEGDQVRLVCEVWVENQRGERVVKGEASALVPR
jgi:acyl dehydratase